MRILNTKATATFTFALLAATGFVGWANNKGLNEGREAAPASDDSAAKCTSIDVREMLGPVRFQDDKAWCYAFTAADLLTYRFGKELKGERVSAVYTALAYNQWFAIGPYSDGGGLARFAVDTAIQEGLCPQSIEDEALRRGPIGSLSEKLEALRTLKDLYDEGNLQALDRKLNDYVKADTIFAAVDRQQLMRALRESSKRNFPIHFADLLCGERRYRPVARIKLESMVSWLSSPATMVKVIDEQLEAGNIVTIGYYSAFLIEGNGAPQAERHLSVLVGRRWNATQGRCEYLIRNSWGPECLGYAREYRAPENCQKGHIWVSKEILEKNLYAITFIK